MNSKLQCGSHLDVLGALQQPFVKVSGVSKLLLLNLKVNVGLPEHLEKEKENTQRL